MRSIVNFFRQQDQLGSSVTLHYKQQREFGTVLGGCCSVLVNLFFALFICSQLYAWILKPSFDQTFSLSYIPQDANEYYTVKLDEFLPIFTVGTLDVEFSISRESGLDFRLKKYINDPEMFDFKFYQISDYFRLKEIDAVLCTDLINSWTHLSQFERDMFLQELPLPRASLCPNTTEFMISGGMFGEQSVKLGVYNTDKSRELGLTAVVYQSEITRYYSNEFYMEHGFLPVTNGNQNSNFLNDNQVEIYIGELWKTEINLFDNPILDTSALTYTDYSTKFKTYDTVTMSIASKTNLDYSGMEYYWRQGSQVQQEQYTVYSLDILLGVVGGLSTIFWGLLQLCFHGYEEFKLQNSLIGQIYPRIKPSYDSESEIGTSSVDKEQRAQKAMI